jgi:N,N'-diacetylbacillosaminyl-diphospho-undecaprenol alpha-1,3-N-acetylgalactosaminyltransferase
MKTIVFLSHFDGNLYHFRLPIMQALAKIGWRTIALAPSGEYSGAFANFGIEHIDYKIDRGGLNPFAEIAVIFRLARIIKTIKPDVLHCFTVKPNIYGAIAGKIARAQSIYATVTGLGSYFIDEGAKAKIVRAIILRGYKIIAPFCKKILFQNEDDLNFFTDNNIVKKSKAVCIGSSGVDVNYWKRSERRKSGERVVVLFVGRLIKHKGVFELLKAAKNLKEKYGEKIAFIIVGASDAGNVSNAESGAFDEYANAALFVGETKDVKPYYENADIFALPSYREGTPRSVLEAQSMGVCAVTTDAVGCREAIENGVTGLLVPIRDAAALEAALDRLYNDEALRLKMGEAARKRIVKLFSVETIVDRYLALYGED